MDCVNDITIQPCGKAVSGCIQDVISGFTG
jgi:hypothetical protein